MSTWNGKYKNNLIKQLGKWSANRRKQRQSWSCKNTNVLLIVRERLEQTPNVGNVSCYFTDLLASVTFRTVGLQATYLICQGLDHIMWLPPTSHLITFGSSNSFLYSPRCATVSVTSQQSSAPAARCGSIHFRWINNSLPTLEPVPYQNRSRSSSCQ